MLLFIFHWTVLKNTYKQRVEFGGEPTQETDFLFHTLKNSFWPIKKLCVQSQTETVTLCPHTSRFLDLRFVSKLKLGHKNTWPLILRPADSSTNALVEKKGQSVAGLILQTQTRIGNHLWAHFQRADDCPVTRLSPGSIWPLAGVEVSIVEKYLFSQNECLSGIYWQVCQTL